MPTQTLNITANGNDVFWYSASTVDVSGLGGRIYISSFPEAAGFSFIATTQIPAGSTIDSAYLSISTAGTENTGTQTVAIAVEDADPTTNTVFVNPGHTPQAAAFYTAASSGSIAMANSSTRFGNGQTGATNIAAAIQALLDEYGTIAIGERINLTARNTAGSGVLAMVDYSVSSTSAASLAITWTEGGGGGGGGLLIAQMFQRLNTLLRM